MFKIKTRHLWLLALFMAISYPVSVQAAITLEHHNLTAPFLWSWAGIWTFASVGGFVSAFIRVGEIDNRLMFPFISKPLIGTASGIALCMLIASEVEPPKAALTFWAFVASLCGSPVVTGFLVFISDQERQNRLYKSTQDKFIPWSKDKSQRENDDDSDLR